MEEIKFWKSYHINWKTAEEKTNKEQVREGIKKNGLEGFIGGKKKKRTLDSRVIDFPSERKKQCEHMRNGRSKVLKVNGNFVFNKLSAPIDCANFIVIFS